MESSIQIESDEPEKLRKVLAPSLDSDDKVEYNLETGEKRLVIESRTDGFGTLRGATDNAFRLASLALKLY